LVVGLTQNSFIYLTAEFLLAFFVVNFLKKYLITTEFAKVYAKFTEFLLVPFAPS